MTRPIQDFELLCRCLSAGEMPSRTELAGADWGRVVELADRESVGPALWASLKERQLLSSLPVSARGRLTKQHHLNAVKNDRLRKQATEVADTLNSVGIVPMLLKGGVSLFEATSVDGSTRMMHDLDIVVPSSGLAAALEALLSIGYQIDGHGDEWTYHYWPLSKHGMIAPVEIHILIGEQEHILPPEPAWERAVPLPSDDVSLMALSPTHRFIHNILHSQVQDRGHELALFYLKQLLDLAMLCRDVGDIDWDEVAETFGSHGLGKTLHYRVYVAERLLGLQTPLGSTRSVGARMYFERCMMSIRSSKYREAVMLFAGATQPFKKQHMRLKYGVDESFIPLNAQRLRHGWHLLRKRRGRIGELIRARRGLYE